MSKKLLKMIAGVSAGLFLFGAGSEVVEQATSYDTALAATKKAAKKYKIGKKYYTMTQMRKKYNLKASHSTKYGTFTNQYWGKSKTANSGTYNALTSKGKIVTHESKKARYYVFGSLSYNKSKDLWSQGDKSIDSVTGHMYSSRAIGQAGGK